MTPTSLFILTTCCLTAILAIVLLLWHRESRRLGASNADAEARERDAAARLSAAEARLAAAEQAVSAERELRQRYEAQAQALTEQRTRTEAELAALRASSETELASLRAKNAEERAAEKAEREKLEETFRAQFKNLATEILGEHSMRFRQTSQEQIDSLLKPFRDNITDFRRRVEEIYTTQTSQRGELKAELKNLMELNRRITAETTNLTNALKGNSKVQGDWGEMLLETILDSSALIKGIHYQTQYNIKDEEGRNLRPDVVLHLPEKKDIVIDSKVSLTAFVGYTSAESEEERRRHLAAHVASVRQHVAELGRKEYQRRLNSPDFVIMFVPNEPAFLAALQNDRGDLGGRLRPESHRLLADEPLRPAQAGGRPLEIQRSGQEHQGDRRLRTETLRTAGGLHLVARRGRHRARQSPRRIRGCPQAALHGQRQHRPRRGAAAQNGEPANQETPFGPHARNRRSRRRPGGPLRNGICNRIRGRNCCKIRGGSRCDRHDGAIAPAKLAFRNQ